MYRGTQDRMSTGGAKLRYLHSWSAYAGSHAMLPPVGTFPLLRCLAHHGGTFNRKKRIEGFLPDPHNECCGEDLCSEEERASGKRIVWNPCAAGRRLRCGTANGTASLSMACVQRAFTAARPVRLGGQVGIG